MRSDFTQMEPQSGCCVFTLLSQYRKIILEIIFFCLASECVYSCWCFLPFSAVIPRCLNLVPFDTYSSKVGPAPWRIILMKVFSGDTPNRNPMDGWDLQHERKLDPLVSALGLFPVNCITLLGSWLIGEFIQAVLLIRILALLLEWKHPKKLHRRLKRPKLSFCLRLSQEPAKISKPHLSTLTSRIFISSRKHFSGKQYGKSINSMWFRLCHWPLRQ